MKKLKERIRNNWQDPGQRWFSLGLILAALILGLLLGGGSTSTSLDENHADHLHKQAVESQLWTCSMHPQIKQPKPGDCPICGMDLVPVAGGEVESAPGEIKLSPRAIKLADIQTVQVKRRYVTSNIRLVGKIQYDETRLQYISAWVAGRIDRMYVNFTGIKVRKGDHLVSLYSPELISAQQELIEARRIGGSTLRAVNEKLRLWGLSPKQIRNLQKINKVEDHLTIYSPISGIVIEKQAREGMYVKTGTPIYTIADLTRVWLVLAAYETDLPWIRYGQTVAFTSEAYPGETFRGKIAFIAPVLNPQTRTVKIRVNVDNSKGKLKPEMFAHAILRSKLSEKGQVVDENLAGKWISPMHPEIIKDGPGKCDICGMPLVRAEQLGYSTREDTEGRAPIVIPASAPLITGTRAIVYLRAAGKEGVFSGIEVVLGPRAGDYYIVKEGLAEGDEVVVNGAFKIDSDLQIQGKSSMMNPQGGGPAPGHDHGGSPAETHQHKEEKVPPSKPVSTPKEFQRSLHQLVNSYLKVQQALSSDDIKTALVGLLDYQKKLGAIDMSLLTGKAHMDWMKIAKEMKSLTREMLTAKHIETVRNLFSPLSNQMIAVAELFFKDIKITLFRIHCPMALNNKGAYWMQGNAQTRNPYFGKSMLICQDEIVHLEEGKWQKKK